MEPNTFAFGGCVVLGIAIFYQMITDFKGFLMLAGLLLGCAALPYWAWCMGGWHGLEMFNSVLMMAMATIVALKK